MILDFVCNFFFFCFFLLFNSCVCRFEGKGQQSSIFIEEEEITRVNIENIAFGFVIHFFSLSFFDYFSKILPQVNATCTKVSLFLFSSLSPRWTLKLKHYITYIDDNRLNRHQQQSSANNSECHYNVDIEIVIFWLDQTIDFKRFSPLPLPFCLLNPNLCHSENSSMNIFFSLPLLFRLIFNVS